MTSLGAIGIRDGLFMGTSPGFGGTIKRRPCDFVVNEIDVSGGLVDASSCDLPPPPVPPPAPSATPSQRTEARPTPTAQPKRPIPATSSAGVPGQGAGEGEGEDESRAGRLEQLRHFLGGSESQLSQLAKLDAAARAPGTLETAAPAAPPQVDSAAPAAAASSGYSIRSTTSAEGAGAGNVVRIPGGVEKAERARVHRAVQETFPFVKTATERGVDGTVTVVCSPATPLPALLELLSPMDLEALQRMVNRGPGGGGADAGVTLSSEQDRSRRTRVHRAIAEAFPYLQTKTHSDPSEPASQRVSVFWSKRRGGGGGGNKRKRQQSDEQDSGGGSGGRQRGRGADGHGAPWVRFGLRKERREHHQTASALSRALNVPLSALSFGGIKDKMAVTTQACVVKGVAPRRILETNGSLPGVTVGGLSYCHGALSLGELSGNKFSVVVRGVKATAAVVETAVQEARLGGFVNLFGTQRVGSPSAAARGQPLPYEIGRDVLAGDWEAAVAKILRARDTDPPFLRSALSDFLGGKITPKECAARVKGSNRLSVERSVLQGLVRYGPLAFRAAIQGVPYGMRTMWVHAYQSHVWNSLACWRIRELGARAVPGDLVLLDDNDTGICNGTGTGTGTADAGVAAPPSPQDGKEDAPGAETTSSAPGVDEGGGTNEPPGVGGGSAARADGVTPGPAKTAAVPAAAAAVAAAAGEPSRPAADGGRAKGTVSVLTREVMEGFASQGVSAEELLRRVVLPLAGTSVQYPHHGAKKMYRERLEKDGIHHLMWPGVGSAADVDVIETADVPLNAPRAAAAAAAAAPRGSPGTEHSESRSRGEGGGGGGGGGKDSHRATTGSASAVISSSSPSALVPRGAYRRLVCVPAAASWEAAAAWDGGDGGAGESPAAGSSVPCSGIDRASVAGSVGIGEGGKGGGGGGGVGRNEAGDSKVGGGAGETEAETAGSLEAKALSLPVLEDVRLTFTLPPGSFATMFLREVMKTNGDVAWGFTPAGGTKEEEVLDAVEADRN